MTQLDDLQAYTNLELPRRTVLLTVAITGYDGDPNDGGAPAVITGSPAGTVYLRETPSPTLYDKLVAGAGAWVERGAVAGALTNPTPYTIYVDPVSGDDANDGLTTGTAIETIAEMVTRLPLIPNGISVELMAGNHALPGVAQLRTLNAGGEDLNIYGKMTTLDTFDVLTVVDNVITASGSPGWTIGEFIGKKVDFKNLGGNGAAYWQSTAYIIVANTANSIAVAVTPASKGGSVSMPVPTDTIDITDHETKIVGPSYIEILSGKPFFYRVEWDGGGTVFQAVRSEISSLGFIWDSTFKGLDSATRLDGDQSFNTCLFDTCTGYGIGAFGFQAISGDCVYKDCSVGIQCAGVAELGFGKTSWVLSTGLLLEMQRGSRCRDLGANVWVEGGGVYTPSSYVRIDPSSSYAKTNAALVAFVAGKDTFEYVFRIQDGPGNISLFDSSSTDLIGSIAHFRMDEESTPNCSLVAYLAGMAPATKVKGWDAGFGAFISG